MGSESGAGLPTAGLEKQNESAYQYVPAHNPGSQTPFIEKSLVIAPQMSVLQNTVISLKNANKSSLVSTGNRCNGNSNRWNHFFY